ncbi:MAG TPA: DUF5615 family PIN-like protein [Gaiellaceae bacterium]
MRLCVDEHYSPEIARRLRVRGHDVSSAKERAELLGLPDPALLAVLIQERSALMTENVGDFAPIERALAARGDDHWGFVYTPPRSMPRAASTIGVFVEALDGFLSDRRGDDDFRNQVWWLQPPD